MTLNNIKRMKNEKGFTIVELLIVIVIIGILAAIIIVAYNGITQRAAASASKANAQAVQNFVSTYQTDDKGPGTYPASSWSPAPTTTLATLPSGVTVSNTALLSASNGKTTIGYAATTDQLGACIAYFDFVGAGATQYVYVGTAKTGGYASGVYTCA